MGGDLDGAAREDIGSDIGRNLKERGTQMPGEKSILGRGKSKCKGPGVGTCLVCSGSHKETSLPGAE